MTMARHDEAEANAVRELNGEPKRTQSSNEKIWRVVIWVLAIAGILGWLIPQTIRMIENKVATTVSISSEKILEYPTITICNFQPNVTLGFLSCTLPDGSDCFGTLRRDTGDFKCYSFNTDRNNPLTVNNAGLKGLIQFNILGNTRFYPATAALRGAQVIMHALGTVPDLDRDAVFIPTGRATILSIQRTETYHLDGDVSKSWDPVPSNLALDPSTSNVDDVIVIGVLYKALSVVRVEESKEFKTEDFVGGLAGMIGTMLGYDFLGLSTMLLLALVVMKQKGQHEDPPQVHHRLHDIRELEEGKQSKHSSHGSTRSSLRGSQHGKKKKRVESFLASSSSSSSDSSDSSGDNRGSAYSSSDNLPGTVPSSRSGTPNSGYR